MFFLYFLINHINNKLKFKNVFPKIDNNYLENCLSNYFKNLNIAQLQHVFNSLETDKNKLINKFKDCLIPFTKSEQKLLINLSSKLKIKNVKFVKFTNMHFNYPFTLRDIIFLPTWKFKKNYPQKELETTLMHEYIHILQRFNQDIFDKFYQNNYGNYLIKVPRKQVTFEDQVGNNIVINPDADTNNYWFIKQNNDLYYVPYVVDNNKVITNRAYKVNPNPNQYIVSNSFINVDNLNYSKQFNKTVLLTDPNETFVNNLGY
jgi:hypothetical protein